MKLSANQLAQIQEEARADVSLDRFAALVVAREIAGRACGYESLQWYEAQAAVVHAHAALLAGRKPPVFGPYANGLAYFATRNDAIAGRNPLDAHGNPIPGTGPATAPDYAALVDRFASSVREQEEHQGMAADATFYHARAELIALLTALREEATR